MERNKKGQFKKGTSGETYDGFGIWYDAKGYPNIWIDGKCVKLHVYVWEKENGEKPNGYDVHHKDHDKSNYELDNLELLSYSDHKRIHAGWVRDENNNWIKKPCCDCSKKLPLDNFYQRKGMTPSNRCIECTKIYYKEKWNQKKYREKKKKYLKEYYQKNKDKWKNYGS